MELGRTRDLVERLGAQMKFAPDRQRQLPDVPEPNLEVGPPLGQSPEQDVARLAAGRHATASLARIHTAVRELKGERGRVRLLGQEHDAERARYLEALAALVESRGAGRQ